MSEENPTRNSPDPFGLEVLREILHLLAPTDVSELLIERDGARIHIKRALPSAALHERIQPPPPAGPDDRLLPVSPASDQPSAGAFQMPPPVVRSAVENHLPGRYTLKSPMVGIFRAASSPQAPLLVNQGDEIGVGDTVCIIETMGSMNVINTDIAGRVVQLLVKDGQPVQYGQPLMIIDPL